MQDTKRQIEYYLHRHLNDFTFKAESVDEFVYVYRVTISWKLKKRSIFVSKKKIHRDVMKEKQQIKAELIKLGYKPHNLKFGSSLSDIIIYSDVYQTLIITHIYYNKNCCRWIVVREDVNEITKMVHKLN